VRRGRSTVGLLTATLLAGGSLLADAAPAHAAFPGTNGTIFFSTNRDGNRELYSMDASGGAVTRLTNDAATDADPAATADGGRVAFASDRTGNGDIYVMNPDGTGPARPPSPPDTDRHPASAPDG